MRASGGALSDRGHPLCGWPLHHRGDWFTASTSFANPAVTIARALTATFAGIAPGHILAFILAQLAGALAGMALMGWLLGEREQSFDRSRNSVDKAVDRV